GVQQAYAIADGDRRYVAAHTDLPVVNVEPDLDRWIAACGKSAVGSLGNGRLFEQKRFLFGGHHGGGVTCAGELEGRPVRLVARASFVRNRITNLLPAMPRATYSREALQPFFDSLRLGP